MSWGDNLMIGTDSNVLVNNNDSMKYLNRQSRFLPFRGQFTYNNLADELAGKVIESLSQMSYSEFVQTRILDPLGMTRTYLQTPPADLDNVSKCYNVLDDGTAAPITPTRLGDDWLGDSHAGMRSCMKDLMKLYRGFMHTFYKQLSTGETSTPGLPLKQVTHLMSVKVVMDHLSMNEISYGLGLGRVQLPGKMGQLGMNPGLMPRGMPVVVTTPRLVISHQGSMPSALSFVALLPHSKSAVVVTSNALALNDVADWVGQMVLELLVGRKSICDDYLAAARTSAAANLPSYPNLVNQLQQD